MLGLTSVVSSPKRLNRFATRACRRARTYLFSGGTCLWTPTKRTRPSAPRLNQRAVLFLWKRGIRPLPLSPGFFLAELADYLRHPSGSRETRRSPQGQRSARKGALVQVAEAEA